MRTHTDDILADFSELPLPARMYAAASVADDVRKRVPGWFELEAMAQLLRWNADRFESDDAEKTAVEELSRAVFCAQNPHQTAEFGRFAFATEAATSIAERLYAAGWRKEAK